MKNPEQVRIALSPRPKLEDTCDDIVRSEELRSQLKHVLRELDSYLSEEGTLRLLRRNGSGKHELDCWLNTGSSVPVKSHDNRWDVLARHDIETFLDADGNLQLCWSMTAGEESTSTFRFWGSWWDSKGSECGDLWRYWQFESTDIFLVSDGLGSGKEARKASETAASVLHQTGDSPVSVLVERLHSALRTTRGAVVFVGRIDRNENTFSYCSVGNIKGRVVGKSKNKPLLSLNGTVGYALPDLEVLTMSLDVVDRLIFYTDGVRSPERSFYNDELVESNVSTMAARILTNYAVPQDDALVAVVRV